MILINKLVHSTLSCNTSRKRIFTLLKLSLMMSTTTRTTTTWMTTVK
ncbi:unnamed protein product [Schistosoma curassoni]|uniref:Uncharacterized protein n=1 Tax=Schistosoma curassoni TaxID=6186 RepID=A0A183KUS7_9TREM|nr:unnamed protein product [Schistosoma curassoni]